MSLQATSHVLEHFPRGGNELVMMLALSDNEADGIAYVCVNTLARYCRLEAADVMRVLIRLQQQGEVDFAEPVDSSGQPCDLAVLMLDYRRMIDALPIRTRTAQEVTRGQWDRLRRAVAPIVFQRDGLKCRYCGATEMLTVDHIHPIERGGTNEIANLAASCPSCNSSKGKKTLEEWKP